MDEELTSFEVDSTGHGWNTAVKMNGEPVGPNLVAFAYEITATGSGRVTLTFDDAPVQIKGQAVVEVAGT